MSDISLQFHATAEELVTLATRFAADHQLRVVGIRSRPFSAQAIRFSDIETAMIHGQYERFAFVQGDLALPVESAGQFAEAHPGALSLVVGRLTDSGLQQSWLACRALADPIPPEWRMLVRAIRSITKAGVTVMNPDTRDTVIMKHFRYTAGAKALYDKGVPMFPLAGKTVCMLGPVSKQ